VSNPFVLHKSDDAFHISLTHANEVGMSERNVKCIILFLSRYVIILPSRRSEAAFLYIWKKNKAMQPVCYHCGQPVAVSQSFCGNCGVKLHVDGLDAPTELIDERSPRQSSPRASVPDGTLLYSIGADAPFIDPSAPIMEYSPYANRPTSPLDAHAPFWSGSPERRTPPPSFFNRAEQPAAVTGRASYPPTPDRPDAPASGRPQEKTHKLDHAVPGRKAISRRKALGALAGLSVLAAAGFGASLVISSEKGASANAGTSARVVHPAELKASLTYTYSGHHAPVYGVVWEPILQPGHDNFRIASSAADVQIWDAFNGGNIKTYNRYQGEVLALSWCHSTYKIVSGNLDGTAQIWIASTMQYVNSLVGHTAAIRGVSWARDGGHIATASNDMQIGLWTLDAQHNDAAKPVFLRDHTDSVYTVDFSDDSRYLVSGAADRTAILWQVQNGAHLATYSGHHGAVRTIAFAPGSSQSSGLLIASGGEDATVQVWTWNLESRTFRLVTQYKGHTSTVNTLAWSPDGSRIASADSAGQIHIWRSKTAEKLLAFQAHQDAVNALAWSPEGQYLASAGQDRVVHVYKIT
jgi:WD40 repeat protein